MAVADNGALSSLEKDNVCVNGLSLHKKWRECILLNDWPLLSHERNMTNPRNGLPNRSTVLREREDETPEVNTVMIPTTFAPLAADPVHGITKPKHGKTFRHVPQQTWYNVECDGICLFGESDVKERRS